MKPQENFESQNRILFDHLSKNQDGSFVVSTTAFIALIALIVVNTWNFVWSRQQNIQRLKIRDSRATVIMAALRNSRTATYYYTTLTQDLPDNRDFKNCMIDDKLGVDCQARSASGSPIEHFVTLVDESGKAVVGPDETHPVFYDFYGQTCTAGSNDCPFEVFGSYTVTCAGDADQCAQAYEIDFKVQIQISKAYQKGLPELARQSVTQTLPISNFVSRFFPILPPATPIGTPITDGSGPGGWIALAYSGSGGGPSSSSGGSSSGASTPSPSPVAPRNCKTGQTPSSTTASCATFNF